MSEAFDYDGLIHRSADIDMDDEPCDPTEHDMVTVAPVTGVHDGYAYCAVCGYEPEEG